jgi:hypothetical protein
MEAQFLGHLIPAFVLPHGFSQERMHHSELTQLPLHAQTPTRNLNFVGYYRPLTISYRFSGKTEEQSLKQTHFLMLQFVQASRTLR